MNYMDSSENLVDVQNLKMWFPITKGVIFKKNIGWVKAVDDVSFYIKKGETLGLVGESGSGKTTTGRCLLQLCKPTGGKIVFDGMDLSMLKRDYLNVIRRKMQVIFQDPYSSLNPRMRIEDIIADPIIVHKLIKNKRERKDRVVELMELVGLKAKMIDRYPHQFSGGERQRIGVARALAVNPNFIVCDEAVSALDVSIQAQVINLFAKLQERLNLTYLFISHDLAVVRHISDRIAVMYLGHIVEIASCDDIYDIPLHPYTKALLSAVSIPDPELERKRERIVLTGEIQNLKIKEKGCVLQSRCPYKIDKCEEISPILEEKNIGHFVACHVV